MSRIDAWTLVIGGWLLRSAVEGGWLGLLFAVTGAGLIALTWINRRRDV